MKPQEHKDQTPERESLMLLEQHIVGAQFTGTVYGTDVTATQATVLGELVRRKAPSIEELSRVIGVHPSTISRTFAQLSELGFIQSSRSRADNRRVEHRCTPRGQEFVDLRWSTVEGFIAQRLQRFSVAEKQELESFLEAFAGEEAISRVVRLPHDSKLCLIWEALTYAHGVASGDFVQSGHSPTDWVMLSEIKYRRRAPGELATLMRVPRSTISVRLKILQRAGLVSTDRSKVDSRRRNLSLTPHGEEVLAHIERCAEGVFRETLKQLPRSQLRRGIELLKRYVEALYPTTSVAPTITRVSALELPNLRRRAWMHRPYEGVTYPLSGYFFCEENIVFLLKAGDGVEWLLEFAEKVGDVVTLINCVALEGEKIDLLLSSVVALVEKELGRAVEVCDEWKDQFVRF